MNQSNSPNPCAAGCAHCQMGPADRDACAPPAASLHGWRLALSASGACWVPALLAAAGAVAGGESQVYQVIGAAAGLVAGMAVAGAIARSIRPADEEGAWQQR